MFYFATSRLLGRSAGGILRGSWGESFSSRGHQGCRFHVVLVQEGDPPASPCLLPHPDMQQGSGPAPRRLGLRGRALERMRGEAKWLAQGHALSEAKLGLDSPLLTPPTWLLENLKVSKNSEI